MAFANISKNSTQNSFLHDFLRGTSRSLTAREANSLFGIKNLYARLSELKQAGLRVRKNLKTLDGRNKYCISRDDIYGSKASLTSRN
jgi:hypothetical protein